MADPLLSFDRGLEPEESALLGLVDARGDAPWRVVGGISLTARLVRSLELLGIHEIVIAVDREPDPETLGSRHPATRLRVERLAPGAPLSSATSPREVIAVDATLVVDRRLLGALVRTPTPSVVQPAPGSPQRVRLARLDARDLAVFGEPLEAASDLALLDPSEISTYSEEMRGHDPIVLFDASTPEGAKAAEDALVRSTQKHVMDAPARWIDPFFENAMLRGLAPTRVSPNHVTLAALVLGLLAAWWVWRGWLALALPTMFLVGWLDGVDGKLARLRLHYSRFGIGDPFFDFAYENAWWIAFSALMAESGHGDAAVWCGAALIGGNLLDEIAYTLSGMWLGTSLDLLTPADGAFRLIAGRRNVYVMILAVATLAGSTWGGFVVCGAWAVITGVAHGVRLGFARRARAHSESRA
jgi:phosphatidylglycerophosphate synthase